MSLEDVPIRRHDSEVQSHRSLALGDSSHLRVNELGSDDWSSAAAGFSDYTFEQAYEYATAAAARVGGIAKFLAVVAADKPIAIASVRIKTIPLLGCGIAYVSAGPLTQDRSGVKWDLGRLRAAIGALKRELVQKRHHVLRLRLPLLPPLPHADFDSMFADLGFQRTDRGRGYRTLAIDIRKDVEQLHNDLSGKWRTDLRFATKCDLSVDIGDDEAIFSRFQVMFNLMHERKQFDVDIYPEFFFTLGAKCTGLQVLIARKNGIDAAGHVFSHLGDSAVYLFGATNELGRETKAAYLLNWAAIVHAKQCGASWYDLGGIDPDANPGVYRFKSRMGGDDMRAIGPYEAKPTGLVGYVVDRLELAHRMMKPSRPGGGHAR